MKLYINGSLQEVPHAVLSLLLEHLGYEAQSVATAVNGVFVPAAQRAEHQLAEGDKIEVLAPMQGG